MHILLFNEYYPPDTSATAKMAAQVAETLAQHHRVTVVAGRPSYDPEEFYPFALLRRETRNNVEVERVGSTAYPRHQMRRRVSNYLSYLALAVPRALALRPDVVLAMTDPPVAGIAGSYVARLGRRPFVYNIRDLYPDMAVGGDIVRPSRWVKGWEKMHRRALREAARVIVLGDDMRERILSKGIAPGRVVVVRDGTTFPSSSPERKDPIVQEIRGGFPFVALHAGNLGFYGAWETLLAAARMLRNENSGLVFIGEGANRAALQSAAADAPNVRFLPFRPAAEIPHVMAAGDVHVVTIRRGLEGVVVPSKLYSILAAGRPILAVAAPESDAVRIVMEFGCGMSADPDDPAAVAAALRALRNDPEKLADMGRRARETAAKYARVNELSRFVGIVEEAARERNGGRHQLES
ncbi:MAG TPA: glycosyltransferase family 4 protein [Candidatus Acidoferrales bacterium]|nr:glycosyltransferase family 4 protein [Candidatus Acidoferrales bacterium]